MVERITAELERDDPALADELEAERRREAERRYPKPTASDLLTIKNTLRERFAGFHGTEGPANSESAKYDSGMDSIRTIRQVRYGRDAMPDKLRERLQYGYRIRSMLTHHEIEMVVSLLSRNPLMFDVPPAGESEKLRAVAERQTKWLQHLVDALERAQGESLVAPLDDSNAECSVQAAELFLTGRWDDIDEEPREGESEREFLSRVGSERRQKGLPFGLRPLDPLSVYWDDPSGDGSDEVRLIVENKPYRYVYERMKRTKSPQEWEDLAMPAPGATGAPLDESWGATAEVETVRYYDNYWYVYQVAGRIVTCEPHGFPFNPVIIELGNRTSSSTFPEQFHGVTWGRASLERALNDTLTSDFDSHVTYGSRPMPLIVADATPGVTPISDQPTVLKIEPGLTLPPGYKVEDAFKDFRGASTGPFNNLLMSLHRMGGVAEIAGGASPGADTAGYTVNLLMSASMAKYEGLLSSKRRFWQKVGDRARLIVRDVVGDTVELAAPMGEGKRGTRWLALSPDDVDETPCLVEIDPLSDENRIAIARWLIDGQERGLVPERRVMEKGFGSNDVDADRAEIDRDFARKMLREARVRDALQEVMAEEMAPPPVLVGPNGEPMTSDQIQETGGVPAPLQPPAVGSGAMQRQQSSQPWRQGTAGQRPPGLQRGEGQMV